MLINSCKRKLKLEYPCKWEYKVIGLDARSVQDAIAEVIQGREYLVTLSKRSSSGKYQSINLEMVVHSDEDRKANLDALQNHAAIRMVL
jgi:putative lipoic acid-binding regulatory protein